MEKKNDPAPDKDEKLPEVEHTVQVNEPSGSGGQPPPSPPRPNPGLGR